MATSATPRQRWQASSVTSKVPLPPFELANRVGTLEGSEDPAALYEMRGRGQRDVLVSMLPDDWTFEGKRVLDFGCGAGRTLRHFLPEAERGEFWGCDIDKPSADWVREHLPPIRAFQCAASPPLPQPSGSFDFVYAISVFTHITDLWSRWLLELDRILAPDGLLIATYMGEGVSQEFFEEPWDNGRVGMNVLRSWQPWDQGGPFVLHSDWWIESHWGRAFEIVDVVDQPETIGERSRHSWALMRKRPGVSTAAELERPEEGEGREVEALRHNIRQLQAEAGMLAAQRERLDGIESSLSWRLTRPLRAAKRGLHKRKPLRKSG